MHTTPVLGRVCGYVRWMAEEEDPVILELHRLLNELRAARARATDAVRRATLATKRARQRRTGTRRSDALVRCPRRPRLPAPTRSQAEPVPFRAPRHAATARHALRPRATPKTTQPRHGGKPPDHEPSQHHDAVRRWVPSTWPSQRKTTKSTTSTRTISQRLDVSAFSRRTRCRRLRNGPLGLTASQRRRPRDGCESQAGSPGHRDAPHSQLAFPGLRRRVLSSSPGTREKRLQTACRNRPQRRGEHRQHQ